MFLGFLGSRKFKWGLIGALAGVAAPIFFFILQPSIQNRGAMFALGVALCSSWALGLGGLLFGHLRDGDLKYRQKMELREREVTVLESLSEAMSGTKNLDSLLYSALRETIEFSFLKGLMRCAAFVKESADGPLKLAAKIDRDPRLGSFEKDIEAWKSLCVITADTGEMIICPDASKDERVHSTEPRGYVAVPLKSSDKVLGVLVYCLPENGTPTFEEAKPLFAAAARICSYAENLMLSGQALMVSEDMAKNEQTLAKKVAQLDSLVEVDRIILSTMDRDEMLHKVSVQIRSLVPADLGGVALCDPETGDFRYIGGWGMEIRSREILQTSDWLGSPVLNRGKPMTRKNIDEDIILSPFDKLLHEMGVKSDLYAPIMRKGKTVGIFFLGCFREGAFNMDDVDTTVVFASRMGLALEHVRLIYDLDEMSVNIIHALASAIDAKSSWTKGHSERVSDYSLAIAERMGMAKRDIERLRLAGLLHDIRKDRDVRRPPGQDRQADGRGMGAYQAPPVEGLRDTRTDNGVSGHPSRRQAPPRALGRHRLPVRASRRGHTPHGAHPHGRGLVRHHDRGQAVPLRYRRNQRHTGNPLLFRDAVRPRCRGRIPPARHGKGGGPEYAPAEYNPQGRLPRRFRDVINSGGGVPKEPCFRVENNQRLK